MTSSRLNKLKSIYIMYDLHMSHILTLAEEGDRRGKNTCIIFPFRFVFGNALTVDSSGEFTEL